jgi:hypothetical protein
MPQAISGALGSAGSFLSSVPSTVANYFSPTAAAAGPSDMSAYPTPGIYSTVDPTTGGAGAMPPSLTPPSPSPTSDTGNWFAGTPAAAPASVGGLSAPPVPSPTDPTGGAGTAGAAGPVAAVGPSAFGTAQDPNAPPTDGQSSWWRDAIKAITGKEVGKGGGGAALADVGNLSEAIQRFMVQRTLQNPSDVLKQSQILSRGLSKGLKRNIGAATGQEMANAGLAGAPGLYSQAVASALAPYRYQQQQKALQDYLAAMQESAAAYPGGPQGGYGSYPGEATTTAAAD